MSNENLSHFGNENTYRYSSYQLNCDENMKFNRLVNISRVSKCVLIIVLLFALISCKQEPKTDLNVGTQDGFIKKRLELINASNLNDKVVERIRFLDSLEKTGYISKYLIKMKVKAYIASEQKDHAMSYIHKLEKTGIAKDTLYYLKAVSAKIGLHIINTKISISDEPIKRALQFCDSCLIENPNNMECAHEKLSTLFVAGRDNDVISMTSNKYQLETDTTIDVWNINFLRANTLRNIGRKNDANELLEKLAKLRKDKRSIIYLQMASELYITAPRKALQYIDSVNKYGVNDIKKSVVYTISAGVYANNGNIKKFCSYADSAFNLGETGLVESQNKLCNR